MPVLTLDVGGLNEMNVECERGGHAAPRKVGGRGYSASGSEWSQIRAELMVVPVVLAPLPWSQLATIRTLFANAARVNCAGDIFNKAGTIVCSGTITDDLHQTADRGTLNLTLFEIGATLGYTPPPPPIGDEVSDGLYWWYDAQALVLSDGASMATWADESGNGRTATAEAGNPAFRPHYAASAINGHPAVGFQFYSGNGRGFAMPGAFSLATEAHLFIVAQPQVASPPYHLGPQGVGQNPQFPAGTGTILDHFGSSVQRNVGSAGVDTRNGFIYHAHAAAGVWESHVGLTPKLTSASNTVDFTGQHLGSWWQGGFFVNVFQGYIGEFKVYKGARTSLEVSTEITALGTKWGITP